MYGAEVFSVHDHLLRAALHPYSSRMKALTPFLRLHPFSRRSSFVSLQFTSHLSSSGPLLKRRVVESESEDLSSSDSDAERDLRYARKGDVVWEPHVVEFPSYHAQEEEKYFHELFAFPWEKGRAERLARKLEKKYFPKHGLDSMLLPEYRDKANESSTKKRVPEQEGFPDDYFEKTKMDYPTLAKALSTGMTSQEKFRSKRSTPSLTKRNLKTEVGSGPVFDSTPSIRTIRTPLNRGASTDSSAVTHNDKDLEVPADTGLTTTALSGKPSADSLEDFSSKVFISRGSAAVANTLPKLPVLKRGMELPEKWNEPGGTVVLLDKPKGWTSFDMCDRIRRLVRVKKVGHAGTLDPMATGLLVICVGPATKLADSYQALTKVYTGTLRLGEGTSSCDAESMVNERKPWKHITDTEIQHAKEAFVGDIMQIPPMFSAIKVEGERLYEKARRGEHLDIPARKISVYEFQIERSKDSRQDLDFRVCCSKGTYIRSLCADLGRALNCCAHLTKLRREKIGDLFVNDAWTYDDLASTYTRLYNKPPLEL